MSGALENKSVLGLFCEVVKDCEVKFRSPSQQLPLAISPKKTPYQKRLEKGLFCEVVKEKLPQGGKHRFYITNKTINYVIWSLPPVWFMRLHRLHRWLGVPTERELDEWFRNNYRNLGYTKIMRSRVPDYIAIDESGNETRIELESRSSNFTRHGHSPEDVDLVICWEKTGEIPVPCVTVDDLVSHVGYHFRVVRGRPPLLLLECECGSIAWERVGASTFRCLECGNVIKPRRRVVG